MSKSNVTSPPPALTLFMQDFKKVEANTAIRSRTNLFNSHLRSPALLIVHNCAMCQDALRRVSNEQPQE